MKVINKILVELEFIEELPEVYESIKTAEEHAQDVVEFIADECSVCGLVLKYDIKSATQSLTN